MISTRRTKKVINGVFNGVTTVELDNLAAETAAYMTTRHPDYAVLAARIAISNLHKETKKLFSQVIEDLYTYGRCSSPQWPHLIVCRHDPYVVPFDSQSQERSTLTHDLRHHL